MKEKWRRGQDSNLQARKGGGFQDRCITNYATSPQSREFRNNSTGDGRKKSEVGSQKSGVGSQKSEVRSRESEVRRRETGDGRHEKEVGIQKSDDQSLGTFLSVLSPQSSVLGPK